MLAIAALQSTNLIPPKYPLSAASHRFTSDAVHGKAGSSHRYAISKLLLESIEVPPEDTNPIWTTEINHRALNLLQLMLTMQHPKPDGRRVVNGRGVVHERTKRLSDAYRLLDHYDQHQIVPCEEAIRRIVTGLVDLFRGNRGVAELVIQVQSLNLQAKKRRALALLIGQVVASSLLYGAQRRILTRLTLSFFREADFSGSINVETSCPLSYSFACPGYAIICALSGILEAELSFSETRTGGTRVKIRIP